MNQVAWTDQREKRSQRGERGQELVEFALVLPILLLLFFGIIEFGRAVFTYNTLANAAREGARRGIVIAGVANASGNCAGSPTGVIGAACGLTSGLNPTDVQVTVTVTESTVNVQVGFAVRLLVGPVIAALGGDDTINLTATSRMQREQ